MNAWIARGGLILIVLGLLVTCGYVLGNLLSEGVATGVGLALFIIGIILVYSYREEEKGEEWTNAMDKRFRDLMKKEDDKEITKNQLEELDRLEKQMIGSHTSSEG